MANKQIPALSVATSFATGDALLIRKSAAIEDSQISYTNFVKTMGSPAIDGFTATSGSANEITLAPSNDALVDTYYDGMRVTFVSPITSTGLVQMQIGALPLRDFFQYNTTTTVAIEENDFIEAVYIGDFATGKFYQTNAVTNTIYSNEYTAVGTVAGDESSTEYALTSAIGATKTSYYPGMSLIFTTDVASKGAIYVNVDGLGNKALTDGPNDDIANNLLANQTILATYNGTKFTKNKFSDLEPPLQEDLPEDVYDEQGAIDLDKVPVQNEVDLTVGTTGQYTTITAAINSAVQNFGEDGGNRIVTINLLNNFTWSESVSIENKNLNWIIIKANNALITSRVALKVTKSTIQVKGSLIIGTIASSSSREGIFHSADDLSNIIFSEFSISQASTPIPNSVFCFAGYRFTFNNGTITLTNVTAQYVFYNNYGNPAGTIFNSVVITTNSGILVTGADIKDCVFYISVVTNGYLPLEIRNGINLANTTINLNNGTNNNNRIYFVGGNVVMDSCNINGGSTGQVLSFNNGSQAQLTNTKVKAASGVTTLYVNGGANVILTAASSFTDNNNVTNTSNQADGAGSYIRKDNTVGGSFSAINGGGIINI